MNKRVLFCAVMLFLSMAFKHGVYAQAPTISYPVTAQDLTRGYEKGNLTVKLVFNGACTGATTIKVAFPASVTYVAGSAAKTGGTAALGMAESSISDLSNPVFAVSGTIATGSEITFTLARKAACGSLATAKDSVYVFSSGGCSNGSETANTVNTYNLFSPSLAITPPAALTNAIIGATALRTTTVTNGGNGALDTLRYYIVYPGGGIVNTAGNAIKANGVSFSPGSTSGDTLFYKIYGSALFGGDNLLTNGESVTITEPVKVVQCNAATSYGAGWGRSPNQICQTATGTSAVTMAAGVPNLSITFKRISEGNFCTGDVWQYTIKNDGTESVPGAGTAVNLSALLGTYSWGLPTTASNRSPWAQLGNFTIAGKPVIAAYTGISGDTVRFSQLTSDPDGTAGLTDANGNGQFDDLPVGDSVVLQYHLLWDCSKFPAGCKNNSFDITPNSIVNYESACGSTFVRNNPFPGNGLRYVIGDVVPGAIGPTDVIGGTTIRPEFTLSLPGENIFPHMSAGVLRLTLKLPAGFSLVGTGSPVMKLDNGTPVAITAVTSGDSVTIEVPYPGNDGSGAHNVSFSLDLSFSCSSSVAAANAINYTYQYINDPAACPGCIWPLTCGDYKITSHCPCTTPLGVNNYAMPSAGRTSFGWTDNTLATKVTPATLSAVALKRYLQYDTALITINAQQQLSDTAYPNLYLKYEFDQRLPSGIPYLGFAGGTIKIKKATGGTTYSCSLPAPALSVSGGQDVMTFNIGSLAGSCLPSGFSFDPGDTFSAALNVVYKGAVSGNEIIMQLPGSKIYFYNLSGTTELTCGNWGTEMYLVPIVPRGTFIGSGGVSSGCDVANLGIMDNNQYLGTQNLFPDEFRPDRYLDSLVVILPPGVSLDPVSTAKGYFVGDNNVLSEFSFPAPVVRGNRLTYINTGSWPMDDVNGINSSYRFQYYVPIVGSCSTPEAPLTYNAQDFYRDFYYSKNPPPTPGVPGSTITQSNVSFVSSAWSYANKPSVAISNLTGVVQGVLPQQYWDIQVSSTGTTTAPYVWLALEKGSSNISIDSVVLKPGNTVMTPVSYGSVNKWYKVSTAGLTTGAYQQVRVYFKYTSCVSDSIMLKAGWNCAGYPNADPSAYACTAAQTYLKVIPQPSQVQLSVARQPGDGSSSNLCSADSALLIVNSAQAANLVTPYITFYPPAGVILDAAIQVEYPLGSGNYQAAAVSSIGSGGYKIDLTAHTGIGANGMLGTASADPVFTPLGGDRQAKIKLGFTTSCGFVSGSSFNFNAYGNMPCNGPAMGNGATATTSPLNITGATATGGAGIVMSFGSATAASCGAGVTCAMTTTPTGLATTAGDTMVYTLPAGLAYAGNLTPGFTAAVAGPVVKIAMPVGVAAGTAINYAFDVAASGSGCGNTSVSGAYQRGIAPLSCNGTPCASNSVVIASATSPDIMLKKPGLVISAMSIDSAHWVAGQYQNVYLFYNNSNGSQAYAGNTDSVEFFCGSSTSPFAVRPLTKNLAIAGADSDHYWIFIPKTACASGDLVTAKIQTTTAAGTIQCLCAATAYQLSGVPLPLTFLDQQAVADQCAVALRWSYTEANTLQSFIIERSSDGVQFSKVSSIAATGSNYIDVSPGSGKWYYRIKAIGTDGRPAYSNTMEVTTNQCAGNTITVYPNPASGQLQVVLQGKSQDNHYELVNALGSVVLQGSLDANHNNQIDLGGIANGVYILKVQTDNNRYTQQVRLSK